MGTLTDEIMNDPEGVGYQPHVDAGDHAAVAALLNEPRYQTTGAREITSRELLVWGGGEGRLARLRAAVGNDQLPDTIRSMADAALRMLQREDTTLDMSRPEIVGMIDALVQASVLTDADRTSLQTLSTREISRAEQLGLGRVSHRDVAGAV